MTWLSRLIALFHRPAPPTRKRRPTMPRVVCPGCQREVGYSPVTQRTARHECQVGTIPVQRAIGPATDAARPVFSCLPSSAVSTSADVRPVPGDGADLGGPAVPAAPTGD